MASCLYGRYTRMWFGSCVVVWGGSWDRSAGRRPRKRAIFTTTEWCWHSIRVRSASSCLLLHTYSVDEENAAVGAWALLEPIEGGNNELEEECGGDPGRRTSSRARTPNNVRNIDQPG